MISLYQKRKGSKKRVRFQLTCSPLTLYPYQGAESGSPGQLEAGTGDDPNTSAAMADDEHLRDPSALLVKNKPAVFHSVHERRVRRVGQDTTASPYKLDSKVRHMLTFLTWSVLEFGFYNFFSGFVQTGKEDVDWNRLRGQPYLWKRHNIPPGHVSPPGGGRGAQETGISSPVSKLSSGEKLRRPQCAGA